MSAILAIRSVVSNNIYGAFALKTLCFIYVMLHFLKDVISYWYGQTNNFESILGSLSFIYTLHY